MRLQLLRNNVMLLVTQRTTEDSQRAKEFLKNLNEDL